MKRPALVEPELRPYLKYSVAAHGLLAAFALGLIPLGRSHPPADVYSIDFVGPSAGIITSGSSAPAAPAKAAPPPSATAAQPEFDEFGRRVRKGHFALPRPSLLSGYHAPKAAPDQTEAEAAESADASAQPSAAAGGNGPAGDAGVSADMPNFPYPWYISQVRQALWNLWSQRMPHSAGECVVMFSILPNGGLTDLRTEISSGDSGYDLTALGAVQDAAPFPPLPKEFTEPFLKIHVTLKSQ